MAAGDERALGELYDRHAATAYALAMAIVGERADAEEVVADAFAQVWRTSALFDPARGSVPAWLATLTRTRALDLLRARGRRARAIDRAAAAADGGLAAPPAAAGAMPDPGVRRARARRPVEPPPPEAPGPPGGAPPAGAPRARPRGGGPGGAPRRARGRGAPVAGRGGRGGARGRRRTRLPEGAGKPP